MSIVRRIYFEIWYHFTETVYNPYGRAILKSRQKRFEFQRKYNIY